MLTGVQIEPLKKYLGIRHLSALRSESIRCLIDSGHFDRSLPDEKHLAEIVSDDYPDERLLVCYNPLLEKRRQNKREELLVATEKILNGLSPQLLKRNEKGKPLTDAAIGIRVGKIVDKYHVAKHFETTIENGLFSFQRNINSIQYESELDGLYVIRTNVPAANRNASDIVRDYKRLAEVEKSFRTIKTTLLDIRTAAHLVIRSPLWEIQNQKGKTESTTREVKNATGELRNSTGELKNLTGELRNAMGK
jgi:hypothetical protein